MSSPEQDSERRRQEREDLKKKRAVQVGVGAAVSTGLLIALITGVGSWSDRSVDEPPPTGIVSTSQPQTTTAGSEPVTETTTSGAAEPQTPAIPGGTSVTADDPEGDFVAAADLSERGFSQFEESPPPGMDITHVTVEYGDDTTVITVRFAGSYRDLEADEDRSVGIRPIFVIGGSYGFEVDYRNGDAYLSGAPAGATVTSKWLDDATVRFIIDGYVPDVGDRVRVNVFSRLMTATDDAVAEDEATVDITG